MTEVAVEPKQELTLPRMPDGALSLHDAASPYKTAVWPKLTPRERLRRAWAMRRRLPNLQAVHDRKLLPRP
jgi:hypothetical protein